MAESPIVSVIVPNYNHAKYLDQRLQSILNQTYRNIEVIILDDCSTDNSLEVIDKYRENSLVSQIIVNEANVGSTFRQWQKGIELAHGEWVWIAESDDYCEQNFIEQMINALHTDERAVVVACNSEWVDETGICLSKFSKLTNPVVSYLGYEFISKRMVYDNDIPNASAAIFHRKTALSIPQDYANYLAAGDRLFWINMSEKGDVIRVNQFLNYFRQHQNKVSPKRELDGTVFFEDRKILEYTIKSGIVHGMDKQRSILHFQSRAFYKKFESEEVRNKVYKTWRCYGKSGLFIFKIRRRMVHYFDLYCSKCQNH